MRTLLYKFINSCFFLIFLTATGFGDSLYEINTGDSNSASWQFTHELSQMWQQKYQDKESYFSPRHVQDLKQRFINLDKQDCKLVIAPLKFVTEMPITDLKVKIVVVLWEVYLAPVDLSERGKEVSFNSHQNWFLPENSYIIPTFTNHLVTIVKDASNDLDSEILEFGKKLNNFYTINEADAVGSDSGSGAIFDLEVEPGYQNSTSNQVSTDQDSTMDLKTSDEVIPSEFTIEELSRADIIQELGDHETGILFYEMIGASNILLSSLGHRYSLVGLEDSLLGNLLKFNPLLEGFSFSRSPIKTVSITYALFVHESEDIEFVKELIGVLVEPPKSYFPGSFLHSNLKLNVTKEISPLFLHEGSIEFFNIY
ncbi:hypothetical protein KJ966_16170 [bacterium]|nr:hypothetical protein [bacterium]